VLAPLFGLKFNFLDIKKAPPNNRERFVRLVLGGYLAHKI
jgi:hypothetical protein